jgi:hypothetical protein
MTTTSTFEHHKYLGVVAEEDVRYVLKKDKSYGASWKKSGGRSAWFMLKRKIDRMVEMMRDPAWPESFSMENLVEVSMHPALGNDDTALTPELAGWLVEKLSAEDIFTKIEAAPSGDDGTVLAEVRDLRRYLMLVEAEMMARGVVANPNKVPSVPPAQPVPAKLGKDPADQDKSSGEGHVSQAPWFVYDIDTLSSLIDYDHWYRPIGKRGWVLESYVASETVPKQISHLYEMVMDERGGEKGRRIRLERCPSGGMRNYYPDLRLELNHMEYSALPYWQRNLYQNLPEQNKYRLHPGHAAWHVEEHDDN